MATYRDPNGKSLDEYPRPSVAVDTAVLTLDAAGQLSVVLATPDDGPRLPGTFLHPGETLADAVLRSLAGKVGVIGLAPTQLHVFDDPARDDRGWVLSVAHLDVVPLAALHIDSAIAALFPVGTLPPLPYGHENIVTLAVDAVRAEYRGRPDPRGVLPAEFSIRDLHTVHEGIAGTPLPRDTFRRSMEPHLVPTGTTATGTVGKPAQLFTRGNN